MALLKRKVDSVPADWKARADHKPLIVKGARPIFDNGYEVDSIIKNISLLRPSWEFIPGRTLIFFDELQKCPDCATSLKSFCQDGRYDVICSGSLMGIYYEEIESNAVGYKEDYEMHSMDFEEYSHIISLTPFSKYVGSVEWLDKAGVINVAYCLQNAELPLKGNYDASNYRIYYHDTGLLIASLDEEAQEDLRANKNFGTYKGAIYENVVGEMLIKSGYEQLYFYRRDNPSLEMDFLVRDIDSLVPVEVKANDGATASLNNLIDWQSYPDVKFGIKLGYKNIGWSGKFYTFPYFLAFFLKRFLKERSSGLSD